MVTFLSGVNLFFLGIVGEYVGRIYEETKARPHYVIRKFVRQQVSAGIEATTRTGVAEVWSRRASPTGTD